MPDKLKRLFTYRPSEILGLAFMTVALSAAQVFLFFSSSNLILKKLSSLQTGRSQTRSSKTILPRFLDSRKALKIVGLLETADRNLGWKSSCVRRCLVLAWFEQFFQSGLELKIGIRPTQKKIEAHVWLEYQGTRLETFPDLTFQPLGSPPNK